MTQRHDSTRNVIRTNEQRRPRDVAINQGQVLLDTDHNEQGKLILGRVEQGTSDILGAPKRLVVQAGSSAFAIAGGVGPGDFSIGSGHGWLDGWMVENADDTTFKGQPHPPTDPKFDSHGAIGLKALVRYIDPVEEPALADKALGNAQASGRTLIDWQVLPVPLSEADSESCTSAYASQNWGLITRPSTARAAFLVESSTASLDPCSLTPEGGYSRLENLLYRIEVHSGAADPAYPEADGPRFGIEKLRIKFSRRNASIMSRVTKIAGSEITVFPSARDPRTWFAPGQYAEIVSVHNDLDATGALKSETLFRVSSVNGDRVTLDATGAEIAATGAGDDGTWFLRLWDAFPDGDGVKEVELGTGGKSKKINLGDGLVVQLAGDASARLRRGDYWTCAARADGTIEWPASGGASDFLEPEGPETRYAILGVYKAGGATIATSDCRVPFAPLTEQIQVISLGGDGQEVLADSKDNLPVKLPFNLRVGVIRGSSPVAGESIKFTVVSGGGEFAGGSTSITVTTGADGVAEAIWSLGSADPAQQVEAVRLDEGGSPTHAPIRFNGFLSRADQTSFDPSGIPALAGAFDVQTAIEMLAGQGQVGCSTYVIREGSDWVAVLEAIKDGEDASVCFQRGTYQTDRTVDLAKKGHLKISGAGPGTRIIATGVEVALKFESCASVDISHLHVSTPSAAHEIKEVEHRQGSITIYDCPEASVSNAILQCGPGASAERSGLRIAGVPLKDYRASVKDCEFRTGYMQDALIISDCDQVTVRDNTFSTVARPAIIDFPILIKGQGWLNVASRGLIRSIKAEVPPQKGTGPIVKGRKFTAQLKSAVPQAEWNEVVKANPPKAEDERSKAGFDRYVERLIAKVMEDPSAVPSFKANLEKLEADLGDQAEKQLSEPVRRNLLASTVGKSRPLKSGKTAGMGRVWLDAGGHFVSFDSPLPTSEWQAALNNSGGTGQIDNHAAFRRVLFRLSKRMLTDSDFASKLPSFEPWRKDFVARLSSVSRDAISCVGKALGSVSISGNRIENFQLGIRVATSHRDWVKLYLQDPATKTHEVRVETREVDVYDNQMLLRTQGPGVQAVSGMFIGNAETVRIHRNDIHYADIRGGDEEGYELDYLEGMRLYGRFGRLVSVKDNHVTVAPRAIRLTIEVHPQVEPVTWPYNWVFADNMGCPWRDEYKAVYLEVPDPSKVVLRNNRP